MFVCIATVIHARLYSINRVWMWNSIPWDFPWLPGTCKIISTGKFFVGEYGTLGVCNIKHIANFIWDLCHEPADVYIGQRGIDDEGNDEAGNDELFEVVLPQGHLDVLKLESETKVKVGIYFENKAHPISCVRTYINDSTVSGWVVTFVGDEFANAIMYCDSEEVCNEESF